MAPLDCCFVEFLDGDRCESRDFLMGGSDGVRERDLTFTIWSGSSIVLEPSPDVVRRGASLRRLAGTFLEI